MRYSYYRQNDDFAYRTSIRKEEMIAKLCTVDSDNCLIINTTKNQNLVCAKEQQLIESLINNVERGRIREFRAIKKDTKLIYQLLFRNEPDCNSYIIVDDRK